MVVAAGLRARRRRFAVMSLSCSLEFFFFFLQAPPTSRPRLRLKAHTLHTHILSYCCGHSHHSFNAFVQRANPNPHVTMPACTHHCNDPLLVTSLVSWSRLSPPPPPLPARERDGGSSRRSRRDSRSRSSGRDGRSSSRRVGEDRGRSSSGRGRRGGSGDDDRDKMSARSGRAGGGGSKQAKPPPKAEKKVGCGNSVRSRRRYLVQSRPFGGGLRIDGGAWLSRLGESWLWVMRGWMSWISGEREQRYSSLALCIFGERDRVTQSVPCVLFRELGRWTFIRSDCAVCRRCRRTPPPGTRPYLYSSAPRSEFFRGIQCPEQRTSYFSGVVHDIGLRSSCVTFLQRNRGLMRPTHFTVRRVD